MADQNPVPSTTKDNPDAIEVITNPQPNQEGRPNSRRSDRLRSKSRGSETSEGSFTPVTTPYSSDVTDGFETEDGHPLQEIVGPLSAATRVALDTKNVYPKGARKRIRKAAKRASKPETLERAVAETTSRFLAKHYTDEWDFEETDDVLDKKLRRAPPAAPEVYESVKKSLKRDYSMRFSARNEAVVSFIEDFVESVNLHRLNFDQAGQLLTRFFGGQLRSIVKQYIKDPSMGPQAALDAVKRYKSTNASIDEYRRKIHQWKLPKNNMRESTFDLYGLFRLAFPTYAESAVLLGFKEKVMSALPEYAQERVVEEEARSRRQRLGEELNLHAFINVVDGALKTGRGVNLVEAKLPEGILTRADLPSIIKEVQNMSLQNSNTPNSGAGTDSRPFIYIRDSNPLASKAENVCRTNFLQSKDIQPTTEQTFTVDAQGQIWPKPPHMIRPFPRHLATYQKDRTTGRFSYTKEIRDHMRNKCVVCGLDGHVSSSPTCPYYRDPNTNGLCQVCRAGFHAKCRYPTSVLQLQTPNL